MNKILVSVVVPVYNSEKTIIRCLESIKNQKYSMFECIVVNDGSYDRTKELIDDFSAIDDRFLVINKENEGPSNARNTGINCAKGKYVVFVDSDDVCEANYISGLIDAATKYDVDLAMCRFYKNRREMNSGTNRCYPCESREESIKMILELIKLGSYNSCCCKLYNLNIIRNNNVRFPANLMKSEDLVFNIVYAENINKIVYYDSSLYYYDTSNSKITKTKNKNEYESREPALKKLSDFIEKESLDAKQLVAFLYIKLLYADIMNHFEVTKSKNDSLKRISYLFHKQEIQESINDYRPSGVVGKTLFWGVRDKKPRRVMMVSRFILKVRGVFGFMRRPSV